MIRQSTRARKGARLGTAAERRRIAENLCVQLLFAALGALLGSAELLFGAKPFGIALAAGATAFFPAVATGAAVFYAVTRDAVSLIAVGALAAMRLVFSFYRPNGVRKRHFFAQRAAYRVLMAATVLLGVGIYRLTVGGFRIFDLLGLLLSVAAGALTAFLFAGAFQKKDRLFPYSREAGIVALVLVCIFSMRAVSFFGVYPSAVAAVLAALLPVAYRGISFGAVGGALAGLCFEPRLAPAFLLCGLCFGLLEKSSRGGGILCGGAAASVAAYLAMGRAGVTLLLPALLTAGALFLAGDSAGLLEGAPLHRVAVVRRRTAAQSAKIIACNAQQAQMRELSEALSELSGTLFELSSRLRRPALSDLRRLCDKAFDEACPGCRNRDVCWGTEYRATADALGAIGTRLQCYGSVGAEQLPAALSARCPMLQRILERINEGALRLAEEALRGDKTSVVAADYAAIGRIIADSLSDGQDALCLDTVTGERIFARLQRLGYGIEAVAVCGKRHRKVILRGIRLQGRHLMIRELRRILEQHCRFSLGAPQVSEADGVTDMVFSERCRLQSVTVKDSRAKGRGVGRYCGDSVTAFSVGSGYDYACLCDGMGSGNGAALTSALASALLCRILQAGGRAETALRMLNGFLSARGAGDTESSTTVDLLEIDRVSGEASLFKCGAAPTYLLRRGQVTRFTSRTAPVGILESLDAERLRFCVEEGDVLVQVSDGITKGEEDCPWLAQMLEEKWDGDRERFTRMVLNREIGRAHV